ncbi:thioredoxin H2-like [Silene latifolia]
MGSNVSSTSCERKEAKARATPRAYRRCNAHRWTDTPPAESEVATDSCNFKNSNEDQSNMTIEIIRPNTNRVISFHSCSSWREYFQASKHSDKLIVIFFSASWCGFCRYMEPIVDDLATEYTDIEFHKNDIDKLFEISREFQVTVMPTFIFIKRGKEVDKVIGTNHQEIRTKIEKHRA